MIPQIDQAYRTGEMPPMLPAGAGQGADRLRCHRSKSERRERPDQAGSVATFGRRYR